MLYEVITQRFVPVLQCGLVPAHVLSSTHATQVDEVVSHAGVAPMQRPSFVPEHSPHEPSA